MGPFAVTLRALVHVRPAKRRRVNILGVRAGGAPGTPGPRHLYAAASVTPERVTRSAAMLVEPLRQNVLAFRAHRTGSRVDGSRTCHTPVILGEGAAGGRWPGVIPPVILSAPVRMPAFRRRALRRLVPGVILHEQLRIAIHDSGVRSILVPSPPFNVDASSSLKRALFQPARLSLRRHGVVERTLGFQASRHAVEPYAAP